MLYQLSLRSRRAATAAAGVLVLAPPGSRHPCARRHLRDSDEEAVVDVPDLAVPGARAQLITDAGSADLYGDGTEAKDLDHAEWKKPRSVRFTVSS
ncbi:hypothetical protein [Streptomyces sp900116325]|uniref:hypothetical protein n=1 Tax=Streptomyces sp. 900116325 TaxID=3154295 RepID=UPI0033A75A79